MSAFDFINGEKIDLTKQSHRDIVIQRNKELQSAIENGLDLFNTKVSVQVNVEFNCLKCGDSVHGSHMEQWDGSGAEVEEIIPSCTCTTCKTKYRYFKSEEAFYPVMPEPELKPKKVIK